LKAHGFVISMWGKGNCYGEPLGAIGSSPLASAMVETVSRTIKAELVWRTIYKTRIQAQTQIGDYIDAFYNPRRRHSALGYKSPIEFENINLAPVT
jgi:putative transposase